jgi:surface polysaccharide O-acyltransferase-like enzyme
VIDTATEAASVVAVPRPPARLWALDALRVAAIAGVVAIHVVGQMISHRDLRGGTQWWTAVIIDIGSIWVVPVFVMISGALVLAPRAHAAGPAAFYRKRFVRILPALLAWHLVYLFAVRAGLRNEDLTLDSVTQMVIDAKVWTALYFLWLIAGLYLVAPVFAAFLREGRPRRAMITAAAVLVWTLVAWVLPGASTLLGSARPISLGAWTQWCPYVGYFLAGWALHRVVLSRRGIALAALIAAAALAEEIWQYGHRGEHLVLDALLPVGYLSLTTAVAALCLFLVALGAGARVNPPVPVTRWLKRLSDASFGVFLVHLLIFEVIRQTVPAVRAADSLGVLLAAYAVVLVSSFAVSIGASKVPYLRTIF